MEHGTHQQMRIQALVDQQKLLQKHESDLRQIQQKQQTNMELLLKELYSNDGSSTPQASLLPSLTTSADDDEIKIPPTPASRLSLSRSAIASSVEPLNQLRDSFPSQSRIGSTRAVGDRAPPNLTDDQEPKDKIDSSKQVTVKKRKGRTSLDSDPEFTDSTANKIPRKRTIHLKAGSSRDEKIKDNFTIPNKPEGPRQCRYPKISSLKKYANIVEVDNHVVELHCKFCQGNVVGAGLVSGVLGMQCHIQRGHCRSYNWEWVIQNCIKTFLTKADVEKVKAGKYRVEQLATRSFDDVNELEEPGQKHAIERYEWYDNEDDLE